MFSPVELDCLVRLSGDIYQPPAITAEWTDYFDAGSNHGVCYGLLETEDTIDIIFRGSKTLQDWFRDFQPIPWRHPQLGFVDEGFYDGLDAALKKLLPVLLSTSKRKRVGGHSLGAARALLFSGLLIVNQVVPDLVAAFAPPKPGFHKLTDVLSSIEIYSFRNGIDPVPEAPLTLPLAPYEQPRALTAVRAAPPDAFFDPFAWHAVSCYQRAVAAMLPPKPAAQGAS